MIEKDTEDVDVNELNQYESKYCKIQPTVYKTFLIINGNVQEPKSHPFTVEWIPNAFPKSKFGEMRISFYYGHKKNNDIFEILQVIQSNK